MDAAYRFKNVKANSDESDWENYGWIDASALTSQRSVCWRD